MKKIKDEVIKFEFNEINLSSILDINIGDNKQKYDINNVIDDMKKITNNVNKVMNKCLEEPELIRTKFFDQDKKEALDIKNGQ